MLAWLKLHLGIAGAVVGLTLQLAVAAEPRSPIVARAPFPWRTMGSDDLRELSDVRVETELRLEMIRRARHTIDIIQYVQPPDAAVARPLLNALRDAANRGVQVRFLTNAITAQAFDLNLTFESYLIGLPTEVPIQCLTFAPPSSKGWGLFDLIHQKLLIVDGEQVVTGGRAYGEKFMDWLDDGFVIKGVLAVDSQRLFDRAWSFARSQQKPRRSRTRMDAAARVPFDRYSTPLKWQASDAQRAEVDRLLSWLEEPPALSASGVQPRGRLLHFDYLQQRWMNRFPTSPEEKLALLKDPILDAAMERMALPETREVLISAMSLMLHPRFKAALIDAARRGVRVRLFTNSEKSNALFVPMAVNWKFALPDMVDLLEAGVRIDAIEANPGKHSWFYLHKKVAIVDDAVFLGSHNFNLPSTLFCDETTYEIEDAAWTAQLRARLEAEIDLTGTPLEPGALRAQMARGCSLAHGLEQMIGGAMLPLF